MMATAALNEQLLTEREAAEYLRVSPRTVFSLRNTGKLACAKIGRSVRYRPAELERFVLKSEATAIEEAR